MRVSTLIMVALFAILNGPHAMAASQPLVVLELFTSQGCSSCPPADALLKQLAAEDSALLPLSFHVHYWDNLGWKDPFSSTANTERQKIYAKSVGQGQLFTPQLVVNGSASTVGSQEQNVRAAIAAAKEAPASVDISITRPATGKLAVVLTPKDRALPDTVDVWGVSFNRYSKTDVGAGENNGRTLESINNVTAITYLGSWHPAKGGSMIQADLAPEDGFAVIAQAPQQGRILGAAVGQKPSATY